MVFGSSGFLQARNGSFRKLGVPYFGVLIIRILLFRVYWGSLFSETPKFSERKATVPLGPQEFRVEGSRVWGSAVWDAGMKM